MADDFLYHKEHILASIKEIKDDFGKFKDKTDTSINKMEVSMAILSTKMLVGSAVSSTVMGIVIAFVMNAMLGTSK